MNAEQHRHDWTKTEAGYACAGCPATTSPCNTCRKPLTTELLICGQCLTSAKKIITDIQAIIGTIPDAHAAIMGLQSPVIDKPRSGTADPAILPFGLDACYDDLDHVGLDGIHTEAGCLDVLGVWAASWADMHGAAVHQSRSTLVYLVEMSLWAAQTHPAWLDYLDDARAIRAKVRHLAGLTPEVQPVPCTECGGRVIQDWTKAGLDDALTCTGCAMVWQDAGRLHATRWAALVTLPTSHPDALVTIEDAKRALPQVRGNTIDVWVKRGKLEPKGADPRGVRTFRLGDIIGAWDAREVAA